MRVPIIDPETSKGAGLNGGGEPAGPEWSEADLGLDQARSDGDGRRARREARLADDDDLTCAPLAAGAIASIPPRPWAYGYFLLFGHAGAIGAVDGGGKGAIAAVISLAMITGRQMLGERVWRTGQVAIISYEDDEDEWRRRLAAACLHHGVDYETVIQSVHFIRRPARTISLAATRDGGIVFPDGDAIIRHLRRIGASLLIIDPLNHAHGMEDGNSNVQMAIVAREANRIASESGAAVLVLHHLRKGATGTVDDLMGAVALRATFRSCRILARMSEEEAEKLGLKVADHWRHIRVSGSKENYAPPPERGTWYRLESVKLENAAGIYVDGDNVQAAATWTPPSAFEGISLDKVEAAFQAIRRGPAAAGEFYSPNPKSARWVGAAIAGATGCTKDEARRILKTWLDNDVLVKSEYDSPERREPVGRVTLNEAKAAEILAPLRAAGAGTSDGE